MGCAAVMPADRDDRIEVERYQKKFVEESDGTVTLKEVQSIPIYIKPYYEWNSKDKKWKKQYGGIIGTCYPWGPFAFITINEGWWYSNFNELKREQVIFHELGHCLLYKNHITPTIDKSFSAWWERLMFKMGIFEEKKGWLKDFCPSSYMYPYILSKECIEKHYDYYMDELFDRTTREIYENGH